MRGLQTTGLESVRLKLWFLLGFQFSNIQEPKNTEEFIDLVVYFFS